MEAFQVEWTEMPVSPTYTPNKAKRGSGEIIVLYGTYGLRVLKLSDSIVANGTEAKYTGAVRAGSGQRGALGFFIAPEEGTY